MSQPARRPDRGHRRAAAARLTGAPTDADRDRRGRRVFREGLAGLLADRGHEVVRRGRRRRGAAGRGGRAPAGRRRGRRPDAADAHRRGPARRDRDPPRPSGHRRPGVLPVHRDPLRAPSCSRAAAAGVGYLLKDRVADVAEFVDGAAAGWRPAAPRWTRRSSASCSAPAGSADGLATLTPREREVLALMAEGRSQRRDRRRARGLRAGRWRSTSPASSPSSACRRTRATTAACWPCSATLGENRSSKTGDSRVTGSARRS